VSKFNVTRIVPEGFMHTSGFNEVIESLSWSLAALGHEVNVTQNWLSEHGETNIIFGAEVVADHQRFPKNSIIFNLEQPSHPNMTKVRRLAKDCIVWDFSLRNCDDWAKAGIEARHVPIGYTPNLSRIPKAATMDWDVFFAGWLTPRRVALIDALRAAGLKVFASAACYGGGRDNIISRSKICLNVHHDGRDMFEIVRCSYLMANSKMIITEESIDEVDYSDFELVEPCNYRSLVDRCKSFINTPRSFRDEWGERGFDSIRKRDFTASVARALNTPVLERVVHKENPGVDYFINNEIFPGIKFPGVESFVDGQLSGAHGNGAVGKVLARYQKASAAGDMKDFLPWIREHARGNIMEIGVRDGASTSAFLLGLETNGGHLYSVDAQDCSHLFKGHPQWTFIHSNSTDFQSVIKRIPFELDLLLIDGDHARAGVISDFQYARQLRPGGCVLFHDIAPEDKPSGCADYSWPGDDVKNVFEEFAAALAPMGWRKEIIPGRYGMGILWKPVAVAA
jgi:hypothetical protein